MPYDDDVRDEPARPTLLGNLQLCLDFSHRVACVDERFVERFWRRVQKSDSCWMWKGPLSGPGWRTGRGYGAFYSGKNGTAHRFSWELHFGPIPPGLFVCHKCDTPPCVNPEHLFLGTSSDNSRDMWTKGRGRLQQPGVLAAVHVRGSTSPQAKLNEEIVREIRTACAQGANRHELARRFAVTSTTIDKIVWRQTWRHVA
jgi:hypothetical protein